MPIYWLLLLLSPAVYTADRVDDIRKHSDVILRQMSSIVDGTLIPISWRSLDRSPLEAVLYRGLSEGEFENKHYKPPLEECRVMLDEIPEGDPCFDDLHFICDFQPWYAPTSGEIERGRECAVGMLAFVRATLDSGAAGGSSWSWEYLMGLHFATSVLFSYNAVQALTGDDTYALREGVSDFSGFADYGHTRSFPDEDYEWIAYTGFASLVNAHPMLKMLVTLLDKAAPEATNDAPPARAGRARYSPENSVASVDSFEFQSRNQYEDTRPVDDDESVYNSSADDDEDEPEEEEEESTPQETPSVLLSPPVRLLEGDFYFESIRRSNFEHRLMAHFPAWVDFTFATAMVHDDIELASYVMRLAYALGDVFDEMDMSEFHSRPFIKDAEDVVIRARAMESFDRRTGHDNMLCSDWLPYVGDVIGLITAVSPEPMRKCMEESGIPVPAGFGRRRGGRQVGMECSVFDAINRKQRVLVEFYDCVVAAQIDRKLDLGAIQDPLDRQRIAVTLLYMARIASSPFAQYHLAKSEGASEAGADDDEDDEEEGRSRTGSSEDEEVEKPAAAKSWWGGW